MENRSVSYAGAFLGLRWVFIPVHGLPIAAASLVSEHRLSACRLQQLWYTGLGALQHVEPSWTKDQTCVRCIGRQTPVHCTARKVHAGAF